MKGQYYRIDWDTCDQLHLYGREAMVYCALIYLCKKAPYTGSATELANFSHCGKSTTALRMLWSLEKKGLISRGSDGIKVLQIAANPLQNEVTPLQVAAISKEKEKNQEKKENIIKKENNNVCLIAHEETHTTATPLDVVINNLFHMDTIIPTDKPIIPANTGYYKIIVIEYGYLNPKKHIDEMYNFYESHGWPRGGSKLELMRFWMRKYIELHPKQQPNLSETERLVLRTFLDNIEQRLIVRLFNVITGFEVYDTKIVFVVRKENIQDFAKWLESLPLAKIFAAYNRIVTVQPSKI